MVSVAKPRKSNFTRPIASTSSLSNWLTAASLPGCWYSGQKSVMRARRDQHAAGVHADVAHHAFHLRGQRQQLGHLLFGGLAAGSSSGASLRA